MLRAALLALGFGLVAGCPSSIPDSCTADVDCGAEVCARNGKCVAASDVHSVKVTWTIRGAAASATTCASMPDLYLYFDSRTDMFGFAPVPCNAGQFSVDKLPKEYTQVEIGADNRFSQQGAIDPQTGRVAFDLQ